VVTPSFGRQFGRQDGTPGMGPPASAEINREPHEYTFAGSLGQGAGALEDNFAIASSRDGRSVVLGGRPLDISVVDRDPLTGALSHNHYLDDVTLDGVEDLAFAPDDQQAYGADGRRLACILRNTVAGQLSVSQILEDDVGGVEGLGGARSVAISKDGASVYVAASDDDAVSVFDRDPWSGDMSFVEAYFNDTGGITGMSEPAALAVSPDGASHCDMTKLASTAIDNLETRLQRRIEVVESVGELGLVPSPRAGLRPPVAQYLGTTLEEKRAEPGRPSLTSSDLGACTFLDDAQASDSGSEPRGRRSGSRLLH